MLTGNYQNDVLTSNYGFTTRIPTAAKRIPTVGLQKLGHLHHLKGRRYQLNGHPQWDPIVWTPTSPQWTPIPATWIPTVGPQ